MASDAGAKAPPATMPPGTFARNERQEVLITDPLDPTKQSYVYLVVKQDGPTFNGDNGYVRYQRDANADQWIDRSFFADNDPEKLGTSNTGYGPNLSGTVCDAAGTPRNSNDRFPRDGVTVSTRSYRFYASGRWMVRGMQVAKPGQKDVPLEQIQYGEDIIDRWKGRAFHRTPTPRCRSSASRTSRSTGSELGVLASAWARFVRFVRRGAPTPHQRHEDRVLLPGNVIYATTCAYNRSRRWLTPRGTTTTRCGEVFNENSIARPPTASTSTTRRRGDSNAVTQVDRPATRRFFDMTDPTLSSLSPLQLGAGLGKEDNGPSSTCCS